MKMTLSGLLGSAALACSALLMTTPAQAITIDPIFSSGCSNCGLPESDQVSLSTVPGAEAAITAADSQIASQFGGNMTTNIVYVGYDGPIGFLGASSSGQTLYTYNDYVAALTADAAHHLGNTVLNSAVANLGSGNGFNDPSALIALNTTAARNLGLTNGLGGDQTPEFDASGNFVGSGGVADAVVFLNINQPLSYVRPFQDVPPGLAYDAETTMEHETDEALGIGGAGSTLNNPSADVFGPLDLYRYLAPGTPSFDSVDAFSTDCPAAFCDSPSPYFSVDGGVTSIDTFNQMFPAIGGDAGDWGINWDTPCPGSGGNGFGGTGDVQDAFSCNNHIADVKPGTPSFEALEAIGFNAVPEPGIWAMMLIGVGMIGAGLRFSRRNHGMALTTL